MSAKYKARFEVERDGLEAGPTLASFLCVFSSCSVSHWILASPSLTLPANLASLLEKPIQFLSLPSLPSPPWVLEVVKMTRTRSQARRRPTTNHLQPPNTLIITDAFLVWDVSSLLSYKE